jgi:AcrR family transcriptional regulator
VLNAQGYRNLRVQDITARAGVATGLFYRYFHDLREIVGEVARDFFAELLHEVKPVTQYEHRYDWIFATVGDVVRRFASNAGILACLFGLSGDYEEFDQIWKENAHKWNLQVAEFLQRELGCDTAQARRMGYVLGAMTEGVVYQALIRRTEDLLEMGSKPDDIADLLAVMWYRAIFFEDPPAERLRPSGRRLIGAGPRAASPARRREPMPERLAPHAATVAERFDGRHTRAGTTALAVADGYGRRRCLAARRLLSRRPRRRRSRRT